ncbi:hypothetical protein GCM10010425_16750 [Streptomyces spororaveus]|uniref:Uncharacterized protein n=1 Tax=Streptomyces spororaveus TaxID=284039 RepID=A0ABQ3T9R0_9ACTN|nr:hypothetical protein Sspor_26960 [Streptomyces spororaveus]
MLGALLFGVAAQPDGLLRSHDAVGEVHPCSRHVNLLNWHLVIPLVKLGVETVVRGPGGYARA